MPRSSDYLLEGYTYHLTQRCHNRKFLMRFARDRTAYRKWLREGVLRFHVPVYGFCLTSNHIHIIVHADNVESVSALMHLASGSIAKQYNLRKGHLGSFWEHPYQCTVIEDGRHLLNCLCYVDLNMVRARGVSHPGEWSWCGYGELIGERKHYRLLDRERLLNSLGMTDIRSFEECYRVAIEQRIAGQPLVREPCWTESLAVGSEDFIGRLRPNYTGRRQFDLQEVTAGGANVWTIKESRSAYYVI